MIELSNVAVQIEGATVLQDVNFRIDKPSIIAVLGPNGAGKSSLLKAILGIYRYTGSLMLESLEVRSNIKKIRNIVGYMPQKENISQHIPITALDVVTSVILLTGGYRIRDAQKKALDVLERVGMLDMAQKPFSKLSGGEQQRVLFARAIVNNPKFLLLDEPFNAMDLPSQEKIIHRVVSLRESGVTSLVVVHDITNLAPCADYVILLNKKLMAFGRPMDVLHEDILSRVYGVRVPVVEYGGVCYALVGDKHA